MKILVLNSGSSSVKYQLLQMTPERLLAHGKVERIGWDDAVITHHQVGPPPRDGKQTASILGHGQAIRAVLAALTAPGHGVIADPGAIAAVGHRVVHGGEALTASVRITAEVKAMIRRCIDLAPLHNPGGLAGIDAAEAALPGVPQVAVFDTAFHATMPRHAFLYALPRALYRRHGIRRYGFHGTSHRWVTERLTALLGRPRESLRLITCHLGNGASVCAVKGGASVDTSMGFTPLEGLIMGTRSGDVDPGVLAYAASREDLGWPEVISMLNKHSGLLGLSGISGDLREIEEEMAAGHAQAAEAFAAFTYRLLKYIGAYAAAMNGVDAIAFSAGIGENSWRVREAVLQGLGFLGVVPDEAANRRGEGERCITRPTAAVSAWVIPTNEELMIARDTQRILARAAE